MLDLPRQRLCEMIAKYGDIVCDQPLRCEGLLRDFCPANRREVNVLVNALKERVAVDLRDSSSSVPTQLLIDRLSRRLQDNQGLTEEMARWAVESWALALGKISEGELTKPRESPFRRQPAQFGKPMPGLTPRIRPLLFVAGIGALILLGLLIFLIVRKQPPQPAPTPIVITPSPAPAPSVAISPTATFAPTATPVETATATPTEAPTLTPAPTEAPTPTPVPPVATESEAQSFVNAFYRALERNDSGYAVSQYDETVTYQGEGQRTQAYIRNDLADYFNRWPIKSFTIGEVRISNLSADTATIVFEIEFSVSNPSSHTSLSGRRGESWTLARREGSLKIVSQERETKLADTTSPQSPPSLPSFDEGQVRQFVREYFSDMERHDLSAVAEKFADVAYYDGRNQRKSSIRADISKHLNKWPYLNYNPTEVSVSQTDDGRLVASITLDFVASNNRERSSGRSSQQWILRNIDGGLRIVSQTEEVVRKKTPNR